MKNSNVVYIEKRPLRTEKDFEEMTAYIKMQGERAKEDINYRNQLLHATGMYDKHGCPKKEFL